MNAMVLAGIPNPVEVVTDATTGVARAVTGSVFDGFGSFVVSWLGDACRDIGRELISVLSGPAQVDFARGWWAGTGGRELAGDIGALAVALTVAFLLLAVLQGLLAGDPGGMMRTALTQLPLSVLGMVCVVGGAELLLGVTDEASHLVLGDAPANLGQFVDGLTTVAGLPAGSLAVALLMVVFLVGAFLVWAELAVRSALVYLLVAFAPLVLAARIWPAARGVFRRLVEMGIAVIVSKFVIAMALALGAAALAGGGPDGEGGGGGSLTLAGLLGGATLMGLAAFTPFVVLRLLPVIEGAAVAHGITASPMRGAQSAIAAGTLPSRVGNLVASGRVAGASTAAVPAPPGPSAAATGRTTPSAANPASRSMPGAGGQRPAGKDPGADPGGSLTVTAPGRASGPQTGAGPAPRTADTQPPTVPPAGPHTGPPSRPQKGTSP